MLGFLKKKILFVINPISGGKDKTSFPDLVKRWLDAELFNAEFVFSEYVGHAMELARQGLSDGFEVIVAVGGDGTINEVASALVHQEVMMGIIPCGSGNGLALSLGLSLNNEEAVKALNQLRARRIDSAIVDGVRFFNMAGIGFDANISHAFAGMRKRGLLGYVRTTLKEVLSYKPFLYDIEVDDMKLERRAFMISIANSAQYGNNAYISPTADLSDGLVDVCILRPFRLWAFPMLVWTMFTKRADRSSYLQIIKGKNIRILSYDNRKIHLDGEPKLLRSDVFDVKVDPQSLVVLY